MNSHAVDTSVVVREDKREGSLLNTLKFDLLVLG